MALPPPPAVDSAGWKDWLFRFYKLVLSGSATAFDGVLNALLDLSGASAGQIKFPASQHASADANTLDDYEEGTWTPALKFGGGSTGITYGIQQGSYTKIGRFVSFRCRIQLTNKGSSTGVATITGVPFAAGQISGLSAGYFSAIGTYASVSGSLSGSTISLYGGAAGTATALSDTDFINSSDLLVNASYDV